MTRAGAAIILACALSACASVTAASGAYEPGEGYAVNLDRQWSDVSNIMTARPRNVRLLTIDGPLLNRLYFASALEPDRYFVRPAREESPTPVLRADMSEIELVEFVADSVAALGYLQPQTQNLRPAQFGAAPAIRFDLSTRTAEGLDMSGAALLARIEGRVHLILYLAPSEHYFARDLPHVEAVFASAALR